MKNTICVGLAALILSACVQQEPEATLPEGVATVEFSYTGASYLRGVNGSYNTSPIGRPAAILDVTYSLECIAENGQLRYEEATQILDAQYVVAPLYFNNPRERGRWDTIASRAVIETGCIVHRADIQTRTTDIQETTMWAILNNVPLLRRN